MSNVNGLPATLKGGVQRVLFQETGVTDHLYVKPVSTKPLERRTLPRSLPAAA